MLVLKMVAPLAPIETALLATLINVAVPVLASPLPVPRSLKSVQVPPTKVAPIQPWISEHWFEQSVRPAPVADVRFVLSGKNALHCTRYTLPEASMKDAPSALGQERSAGAAESNAASFTP